MIKEVTPIDESTHINFKVANMNMCIHILGMNLTCQHNFNNICITCGDLIKNNF